MTRLYLTMTSDEWLVLVRMANQNCREPKQEARFILRAAIMGDRSDCDGEVCNTPSLEKHNGAAKVSQAHGAVVASL